MISLKTYQNNSLIDRNQPKYIAEHTSSHSLSHTTMLPIIPSLILMIPYSMLPIPSSLPSLSSHPSLPPSQFPSLPLSLSSHPFLSLSVPIPPSLSQFPSSSLSLSSHPSLSLSSHPSLSLSVPIPPPLSVLIHGSLHGSSPLSLSPMVPIPPSLSLSLPPVPTLPSLFPLSLLFFLLSSWSSTLSLSLSSLSFCFSLCPWGSILSRIGTNDCYK
ncbi:unnamed protein product [Acanthosepion pharaonis]|uniref:Uncharacterized protein n=1 Tax=Acanthosepion pharaonis TaxID=158019 RepID=A0A812BAG3_ACAPH|nr:unnamed protein product [Sepia pharaonis]